MAILNLDHFPNVCRLCILPKPDEQLIPIECSYLERGTETMLELLHNFTFETPKVNVKVGLFYMVNHQYFFNNRMFVIWFLKLCVQNVSPYSNLLYSIS